MKDKNLNGEAETDMDEDGIVDQHVVGDEEPNKEGEDHCQEEAGQSSFLCHLALNWKFVKKYNFEINSIWIIFKWLEY